MIPTLLRISWINFRRDRVVQALTIVVPIVFFSIFAIVFGGQKGGTNKVAVAIVDEDQSEWSRQLVRALSAEGGLSVRTHVGSDAASPLLDRAAALALVRGGDVPVAIVLPKGLGAAPRFQTGPGSPQPTVDLLADVSDPIAPQVAQGLLEKDSFTAAPERLAADGIATFERYSGPLTAAQQASVDRLLNDAARGDATATLSGQTNATGFGGFGLSTRIVNVLQPGAGSGATIAFYAAGIGVMFLLFSSAGAGGSLLDEEEAGTLGRLLGSRAGMGGVLLGKWLFVALMGIGQMSVMFIWGALVFGLPLRAHIAGFVIMTAATAGAASAFGILLATISRSRQQLQALSTILILTMSALGGSMFPRFLMSASMQRLGLATFNAWALDGYLKVFWRDAPLLALWPQVGVLVGIAVVFLVLARRFAVRWETL